MKNTCLKSTLMCIALSVLSAATIADDDWKPLFTGKDLSCWQPVGGPIDNWRVADGLLSCSGEEGSRWIATKETFDDFELELEFKVSPDGNSGVFLRMPLEGKPATDGMEIQIADDYAPRYVEKGVIKHTGALYGIQPPSRQVSRKAGQWQKMRILCAGRRVEVFLNDRQVIDVDLDAYPELSKDRPGMTRTGGHVGLQNHKSPIEFRNIRIRPARPK